MRLHDTLHWKPRQAWLIALVALLGFCAAIYWPGLSSEFMLDDTPNLTPLAELNEEGINSESLGNFLRAGAAGPLGRPLSLLSFAAQHESWPDNPAQFKLVNLLIHLVNSLLLYLLSLRLFRSAGYRQAAPLAFFVAAAWLLLPAHVSTVLYVVQRMTLLAASFMLLGLFLYLRARHHDRPLQGLASLGLCTLAAALSKENGILLLSLAVVAEIYLHRIEPAAAAWRRLAWPVLGVAMVAGLAILMIKLPDFISAYANRDFTFVERLLTQPHVLLNYVQAMAWPSQYNLSIFHDDFPLHGSLAEAWPWILGLALLAVAAVAGWWVMPLAGLGLALFLVGHSMESSIIPLEIYFEHRNYLPGAGLLIAVGALGARLVESMPHLSHRRLFAMMVAALLLGYALKTASVTMLWRDPVRQAVIWSHVKPDSLRTQLRLVSIHLRMGKFHEAGKLIEAAEERFPLAPHFSLYAISSRCSSDMIPLPDREALVDRLTRGKMYAGVFANLSTVVNRLGEKNRCEHVTAQWLAGFLDMWLAQETDPWIMRKVLAITAKVYHLQGRNDVAIEMLDKAARIYDDGFLKLLQAEWAIDIGRLDDAAEALAQARKNLAASGTQQSQRISSLEARLANARARQETSSRDSTNDQ